MTDATDPARMSSNPYLAGNMAPVEHEVTAFDLPVEGTIPADLEGRWLRNGPNPRTAVDPEMYHWFLGNGMVHGVRLRGGRAEWYRNRYVAGPDESGPNTNVGGFAGTTWAMVEAGTPPYELDYELNPLGANAFHDTLTGPFSAHPKYDPTTGELHAMGYQWPDLTDHLHYVVVGSDGRVTSTTDIQVDDMPMVHDMSLTPTYAIVYDLPVTVSLDLVGQGFSFPFAWNPGRAARVGLLPRAGIATDIIWCDVDPCYVFHPLNAYDAADGTVVVDVCRYDRMMVADFHGPFTEDPPTFDRWVIDPVARRVRETRIDDRPQDFPRHNPVVGLRQHRYGYTSEIKLGEIKLGEIKLGEIKLGEINIHGAILKHDLDAGTVHAHEFGSGRGGAEPVVVPKADGTAEDDCWILTVVYDAASDSSELHILDAGDITGAAVARITLPQRVPFGFHGNWVPDTSVAPPA